MNKEFWNSMSPEDQKIFMELWEKGYEIGFEKAWEGETRGYKQTEAAGRKIRKPTAEETDAWQKAATPVISKWISDTKKSGAQGAELVLEEWKKQVREGSK